MYALVDCNNFFVSCERAFQPQLEGRPVVVLSNNDGCVVARSNESKAMGVKMGTPFFQIRHLVDAGKLEVRSSNYVLYGDLSRRVMNILSAEIPDIEVYSIDEAFLDLEGIRPDDYRSICSGLVRRIRRYTGIPVSIGIAPTKTLAKVANHFAKKYPGYRGVCVIDNEEKARKALSLTPIDDVWGIGWRGAPKLQASGIRTALDFTERPESWIQKKMGVNGLRIWHELKGRKMIPHEEQERRQSICTSRSFADTTSDKETLSLRISDFAGICAQKLRKEGSVAQKVSVFMQTNRFREDLPQYQPYATVRLEVPASSTQEIVGAALRAFGMIFRPEYQYKRAGVTVDDISEADAVQGSLFDEHSGMREKEDKVSELMDRLNGPGRKLLHLGTERSGHYSEGIRRDHCSNLFSTSLKEIITVK